jgi:ribonuclease I
MNSSLLFVVLLVCVLKLMDAYEFDRIKEDCDKYPKVGCYSSHPECIFGEPPFGAPTNEYILALQNWQHRRDHENHTGNNGVKIYGLWKSRCQCPNHAARDTPFEPDKISRATLEKMVDNWSGGLPSDCFLWKHEWACHGICTGLDMEDYFRTAIELYDDYKKYAQCDATGNCLNIRLNDNLDCVTCPKENEEL